MNQEFRCPVFGWNFFREFCSRLRYYQDDGENESNRIQDVRVERIRNFSATERKNDQSFKMIDESKRSKFQNDRIKSDQSYQVNESKAIKVSK